MIDKGFWKQLRLLAIPNNYTFLSSLLGLLLYVYNKNKKTKI